NNEIVEKTNEEKLNEGLITSEEYNNIQNEKREKEYESKTDKQVIELMRNFLNKNKDSLSNDDKTILDSINTEIETIKQEYPKQNQGV
ncbi:Hvp 28 VSH-1 tail protein, partial [Brachyspira hyodysenteriae]